MGETSVVVRAMRCDKRPGLRRWVCAGGFLPAFQMTAQRSAVGHCGGVDDGYRAPHIPRMRIVETLEDPNASPERRLGAAIALTEAGDGDARKIMLRVANATADDELADALRETAEGILAEATVDRLRHVK